MMKNTYKEIAINAYAKINLCLDVKGLLPGGYHEVHMVMQQIGLCDEVLIRWMPGEAGPSGGGHAKAGGACGELSEAEGTGDDRSGGIRITVKSNRPYLPTDRRNLAWQAAEWMADRYGKDLAGEIRIDMKKRIPVAAGLAGGSSNCAAVIHGLNCLWDLGLDLKALCRAGAELGSDVPFCVMGQAAADPQLQKRFAGDPLACHCAVATGRGTDLKPVRGLHSDLVLSKPPISVSTAEAYRGIDEITIPEHPDIDEMVRALSEEDMDGIEKNMINVLENYTLKRYSIVVYTKNKIQSLCNPDRVLMSGSGPTVFGLCGSRAEAKEICAKLRELNRESFWTRTTG